MFTVLLVDGDERIRELNRAALQWQGYRVEEARSLSAAEELLPAQRPGLIVLETTLPDGSGLDWCRRLKTGDNAPLIILSGKGGKPELLSGINAGADDYIAKPYALGAFVARVEATIGKTILHKGEDAQ